MFPERFDAPGKRHERGIFAYRVAQGGEKRLAFCSEVRANGIKGAQEVMAQITLDLMIPPLAQVWE